MIEDQLRALADGLDDRQSPITVEEIRSRSATRTARESAARRRLTFVAAAVVAGIGVTGLAVIADRPEPPRTDDEVTQTVPQVSPATVPVPTTAPPPATSVPASTVPGPAGFPTTPTTNAPTNPARAGVPWWVPTALPDDFSFSYALDWIGHYREVPYEAGDCTSGCDRSVVVTIDDAPGLISTGEVHLGGNVWNTARGPGSMFLEWDDQSVVLTGQNVASDELAEIAAGMRLLPETELPRMPLVCCPYTPPDGVDPGPVVARLQRETSTGVRGWDLHGYTDGAQFALRGPSTRCHRSGPSPSGRALATTRSLVYRRAPA
jgi:hypothetical protein